MPHKNTFSRIYIHVPFCTSKCDYCAFYSLPSPPQELINKYLEKLNLDFEKYAPFCPAPQSIFIGGGTPNSLNIKSLEKLLSSLDEYFDLKKVKEFSIECNPESLDAEKSSIIAAYANRVSMGVQSFSPQLRKTIGRAADPKSFYSALERLRNAGIKNIGTDLIYAIPGQTLEHWKNELSQAADSGVKHISAYALTLEEGSRLAAKRNLEIPDDELSATMWEAAEKKLQSKGFRRYEISNYAMPGFECSHNTQIWFGDTYIGFGPAAASFDGSDRWTNPADIDKWLSDAAPDMDVIPREKRLREIFVMGLRLVNGWDIGKFRRLAGDELTEKIILECKDFSSEGLLEISEENLRLSSRGLLLWNAIGSELL